MLTDDQITAAYEALNVTAEDLCAACIDPARLHDLQERAKKQYRKLVFDLHPDRTNGDENRSQLFRAVTEVVEDIKDLKATPIGRRFQLAIKLSMRSVSSCP
jgi:DnaJ-domain-containing protein 1